RTLKTLQLDYVGLYIVELDTAFKVQRHILPQGWNGKYLYHDTDLCATWKDLGACKHAGLTKSLGVSNFNKRQPELILKKPVLYFLSTPLQNDIVIVGYSSIGTSRDASWVNLTCPPLLEDELLVYIAHKYKKTTAQMSPWFNIQRGVLVIPKSFNPQHIKDNSYDVTFMFPSYLPMKIFYFSLTEAKMKAIEDLNKNIRLVELLMESDHPEYPFMTITRPDR
uniref:Uncharacterized protein n=1 Tax=Oncorhynchus mykiss TaxID=8022 RepID=A0A8C7SE25_ONCMY